MEASKEIEIGGIRYTLKRYTFGDKLKIQEAMTKITPTGEMEFSQREFFINTILYGVAKAVDKNGNEVKVTREYVENLDHEAGTKLYNAVFELNNKSFF